MKAAFSEHFYPLFYKDNVANHIHQTLKKYRHAAPNPKLID